LAAIISPVVSGYLIDRFGNWELPFFGSMLLMAIGAVLAYRMHPEHKFETHAGVAQAALAESR
jgi:cyanate permease